LIEQSWMTPKMSPKFDLRVTYEPSWLPSMGLKEPAFWSSSYISPGEPMSGLTAYALNMKYRMMIIKIKVCE
jgi:hypothetical protein